ncbi:hypothetical protein DERP_015260, partial [Dermatophagoides pteronyssinus]
MDYCNNETLKQFKPTKIIDSFESVIYLYKVFVPILLAGCLLSLILNTLLVIIGTIIQSKLSRSNRSRSPILLLSLNLAATDSIASFLMGFGLLINSYLPVVLNINLTNVCFNLILEIFRLSALIASALHLLALALVHYKGIVNPLHYRIYLMSFICWLLPAIVIASYFSSIPCQGFQHENCRSDVILTFRFRFMIVVAFFLPLVLMLYLYTRIFIIIKRHQKQRLLNLNQSGGDRRKLMMTIKSKKDSTTMSNVNDAQINDDMSNDDGKFSQTDIRPTSSLLIKNHFVDDDNDQDRTARSRCSDNEDNDDDDKHKQASSSSTISHQKQTLAPRMDRTQSLNDHYSKTIKNIQIVKYNDNNQKDYCTVVEKLFTNSSPSTTTKITNDRCVATDNNNNNNDYYSSETGVVDDNLSTINNNGQHYLNRSIKQQHGAILITNTSNGLIAPNNSSPSNNAKALITTLSILGTYILCWMPAVLYLALTCIDHCYYPIIMLSYRWRVIFSFITNGLVILKAIIDPFIYTYRMKEMKNALNRCLYLICPFDCVRNCCPQPPPSSLTTSNRHYDSTWSRVLAIMIISIILPLIFVFGLASSTGISDNAWDRILWNKTAVQLRLYPGSSTVKFFNNQYEKHQNPFRYKVFIQDLLNKQSPTTNTVKYSRLISDQSQYRSQPETGIVYNADEF